MRSAAIVGSLLVATAASAANTTLLPKLDIKGTCQRAQPLSSGEKSAFQGCLNDESQARQELAESWSSFKAAARKDCVQVTRIGGAASYVELLTCLELDKQAREAALENKKSLELPGAPSGADKTPD
jgi:LAS superfamily LD-carboxypeptidase LdcB